MQHVVTTTAMSSQHTHHFGHANWDHFDKQAVELAGGDHPFALPLTDLIAPHVLSAYPYNKETTTVLDFACGTGLMSRRLAPSVKSIVGIDISPVTIDQYNLRAGDANIKGVCVELKGESGDLNDQKFDVITCNASYHHFDDINGITKILVHFLAPGGVLLVTDFAEKKGVLSSDSVKHIIAHSNGMGEPAMKAAFEGAGLVDFEMNDVGNITLHDEVTVFLASGMKV